MIGLSTDRHSRAERRQRIKRPGVMVVSDRQVTGTTDLIPRLHAAMQAGAGAIQLRERDLDDVTYRRLAQTVIDNRIGDVPVIFNRRPQLVRSLGADGLHVGSDELAQVDRLRRELPEGIIIGVSCHSYNDLVQAVQTRVDYVTLSPLFPTASKPNQEEYISVDDCVAWQQNIDIPIFALGGIGLCELSVLVSRGHRHCAVIRGVLHADNQLGVVSNMISFNRTLGII